MNAGKFNKPISFVTTEWVKDSSGYQSQVDSVVLSCKAEIKTLKGYTLIKNGSDFDKAYIRFVIRFPQTLITKDMSILYRGKRYSIEYIDNVNAENKELEIQAKEVYH